MARPMLRYHGGKWKLAAWIISYFPAHRVYVEPYGGGGSVLLRKPRSYAEVYNDLDNEVVNVFRVARDHGVALKEKLYNTPFSRIEFKEAYKPSDCPIEQARRTIARSFMGYGSSSTTAGRKAGGRGGSIATGFRADSNRSGTVPARDWKNYAELFDFLIERMRGVTIENRPAIEVMSAHDRSDALHYVDPTYVMDTRKDKRSDYVYEMTDDQHRELADCLRGLKGNVVLSGYPSPLYDELYHGWSRAERVAMADGAKKRIEVLWLSPGLDMGRLL